MSKRNLARGISAYAIDIERKSPRSGVSNLDLCSHKTCADFFQTALDNKGYHAISETGMFP